MTEKLTAIALYTIKYSDKNSIVHMLTRERGRVALLLPQGNTPASRRRNALFMPLAGLDIVAVSTPNTDIMRLKEVEARHVLPAVISDPIKNALALFTAELLSKVVIDKEDSTELFLFADNAARLLEYQQRGLGNFHICFMLKLAVLLGIYPDSGEYRDGYGFDLTDAQFMPYDIARTGMLPPLEAHAALIMDRMTFANLHRFKYSRAQRDYILEKLLLYYKIHGALSSDLKSPAILTQLFD